MRVLSSDAYFSAGAPRHLDFHPPFRSGRSTRKLDPVPSSRRAATFGQEAPEMDLGSLLRRFRMSQRACRPLPRLMRGMREQNDARGRRRTGNVLKVASSRSAASNASIGKSYPSSYLITTICAGTRKNDYRCLGITDFASRKCAAANPRCDSHVNAPAVDPLSPGLPEALGVSGTEYRILLNRLQTTGRLTHEQ